MLTAKVRVEFIDVDFGTLVPRLNGNAFSWMVACEQVHVGAQACVA